MKNLINVMETNPVIASVVDAKSLKEAIASPSQIIFVLYGTILSLPDIVYQLKEAGKDVVVNLDLIGGISNSKIAIEFIKEKTLADGIISTKANLVREAKEKGLFTILRFFVIDSKSFYSLEKQYKISQADAIDILPGIMPRVIQWTLLYSYCPVIASGLVCEKEDIITALGAGASAISTTNSEMWLDI